jgi:hypothetical protein
VTGKNRGVPQAIYGTVENHLTKAFGHEIKSAVFITLGEPQVHGDTAEPVPFVRGLFPIWLKALTNPINI